MKYTNYTLKDFISDEYFKNWVLSPDEHSDFFWESFLKNNPDHASDLLQAREIIQSISFYESDNMQLSGSEQEQMWEHILSSSASGKKPVTRFSGRKPALWFSLRPYIRVAAVLFLAFFISLVWLKLKPQNTVKPVETIKTLVKFTEKGEKLSTKLPDGSVVVLNANSLIEYPEKFSDSTRRIRLEGEAFFDIQKDMLHPFVIETGHFKTVVLGTSFTISEDSLQHTFKLAVVTGRVAVSEKSDKTDAKSVYVYPKQMISYNPENKTFKQTPYNYTELISWKDGVLYFKNANFNEVVHKLENWYGVTFTVNTVIDTKKDFTGQFQNENLKAVLEGLSFSFDFNFVIKDNRVTINKKS